MNANPQARHQGSVLREVQALRAVAVAVVVLYHLWPDVFPGGYVGVDVFFVISGFLITLHLTREVERTGRLSVLAFWARRIRRLLPASFLVLGVVALFTWLVVPVGLWQQYFREIGASALYVQNWQLAADAVDYLAATNSASPVQHFWTLSVEEQFYIVWPFLFLLALAIARGRLRVRAVVIRVAIGVVLALSFATSVWMTATNPGVAYFATTTRAWEFAAGALLAVLGTSALVNRQRLRAAASWLGVIAIVLATMLYSAATPFPGYAALLPVVGTLLVIWAGAPHVWWSTRSLMGLPPVQWLGDISYSLYLWHWPLIIGAPFVIGHAPGYKWKLVILALSVLLAWGTKVLVEDPIRTLRGSASKPRYAFAGAALGMAILVAVSVAGTSHLQRLVDQSAARVDALIEAQTDCFGAAQLARDEPCVNADLEGLVIPERAVHWSDVAAIYTDQCRTQPGTGVLLECVFGVEGADTKVALAGDSHSAAWFPALERLAEESGWELHTFFGSGCAFNTTPLLDDDQRRVDGCRAWNERLQERLAEGEAFDLLYTSYFTAYYTFDDSGFASPTDAAVSGFRSAWAPVTERGTTVVVIRDVPTGRDLPPVCYDTPQITDCGDPQAEVLDKHPDLAVLAADGTPGVYVADLSRFFCVDGFCPGVIGGVLVYRDAAGHITASYSKTLAPYLLAASSAALRAMEGAD